MDHRKISRVMTPVGQVVSVPVDAAYKDIAEVLEDHAVSAVPVTDADGRVVGVVSESDLLTKEARLEPAPGGAHRLPFAQRADRREEDKAAATTAGELMTAPPLTIGAHQDVVEAARMMADKHVKRLIVTDAEGRLRGVVSRHDVLKVFTRTDEEIRREVSEDVLSGMFWIDPAVMDVQVENGIVRLRGRLPTWGQVELVCATVRRVDGVVAVANEIAYDHDDSRTSARAIGPLGIFYRPVP
jgi:CBS domain-containing protein